MKNTYTRMMAVLSVYMRRVKAATSRLTVERLSNRLNALYKTALAELDDVAMAERLSLHYLLARNATVLQLNMLEEIRERAATVA